MKMLFFNQAQISEIMLSSHVFGKDVGNMFTKFLADT